MSGFNSNYTGAEVQSLLDKIKNFEGGGGKTAVVYHGTEDTTIELTPNVVHKWDSIDSLSLTLPEDEEGYVNQYKVVFSAASDTFTMALPFYLQWVNNEIPSFEAGMQYEVSIEGKKILWAKFKAEMPVGELLEYIENDGIDYILTDYIFSSKDCGYAFKIMNLSANRATYSHLFGAANGTTVATSPFCSYIANSSGDVYCGWDGTATKVKAGTTLNSLVELSGSMTAISLSCDWPLMVFARNHAGVPSTGSTSGTAHMRFYHLQILDSKGNANLDLRPFRRASDGAIGLIDLVSGSFYPSVNGNMVGEPFFPAGDYLEYIENDGEDYIMTDIYMSNIMYGMKYKAAPFFNMGQASNYALAGTRQVTGTVAGTSFFIWYLSGQQGQKLYWNGTEKSFGDFAMEQVSENVLEDVQNLVASDYPLIVFGGNNVGTPDYNNKFRLYYLELLDVNSNPIINLKPFRRTSDNAVGLLDDVSGKFYTSVNGNLVGA